MRLGEKRKVYGLSVEKKSLGETRGSSVDNIIMDLAEIGLVSVDWIGMAQDRDNWRGFVNAVMNFRIL
jgi:hypothetical protein